MVCFATTEWLPFHSLLLLGNSAIAIRWTITNIRRSSVSGAAFISTNGVSIVALVALVCPEWEHSCGNLSSLSKAESSSGVVASSCSYWRRRRGGGEGGRVAIIAAVLLLVGVSLDQMRCLIWIIGRCMNAFSHGTQRRRREITICCGRLRNWIREEEKERQFLN